MQQGWVAQLLVISLLSLTPVHAAKELSVDTVKQWQQTDQITQEIASLLHWAVLDEVELLKEALDSMPPLKQEVATYRLLKKIELQSIGLTPKLALWIASLSQQYPRFSVVEQGEGYEFSSPAFYYPAIAKRLLTTWQQDQQALDLMLMAERKELVLHEWLQGSLSEIKEREALLIRQLGHFSDHALQSLQAQVTGINAMSHLPSQAVLVRLAQVSDSDALYDLLWRLKPDRDIRRELNRLGRLADQHSLKRLLRAAENPSLTKDAARLLMRVQPLPASIKALLLEKLRAAESATWVALALYEHGHDAWLTEVLLNDNKIQKAQIRRVVH